jgi:hypothetical protein
MGTKKKAKKKAKKSKAAPPAKKAARKRAAASARPRGGAARKAAKKARAKAASRPSTKASPRAAAGARAKPIRRRDRPGHIDPKYAADLRQKGVAPDEDPSSFLDRPRSRDDLVEELGEEVVTQATSAEHEGEDVLNQEVPEERGGPFVETSGDTEFGHGTDASNPKGASREPFPRT